MDIKGQAGSKQTLEGQIDSEKTLEGKVNGSILMGLTPDIQIGEVITLEPGQNAKVTLDEKSTMLQPILNFALPKGEKGGAIADSIEWENVLNKPAIPSKTSDLINDKKFVNENYVKNEIANAQLNGGDVEVDLSGYATKDDLNNKADKSDIPIIPKNISSFNNDVGYISNIPSEYIKETELEEVTKIEKEANGEKLILNDISKQTINLLNIYGKTTQDGIAAPLNPKPLVNSGETGQIVLNITGNEGETHTVTFSIPNGLCGVPVACGGNYIDEAGQHWITDEIDIANGIYIQRCIKIVLDGSEDWKTTTTKLTSSTNHYRLQTSKYKGYIVGADSTNISAFGLCDAYPVLSQGGNGSWSETVSIGVGTSIIIYDDRFNTEDCIEAWKTNLAQNPVNCMFLLTEPVVTPLEDIEDKKIINAYLPVTTIQNNENARVKVRYISDIKNNIDNLNKFDFNILHNSDWSYSLVNQRNHTGAVENAYCIDRWIGNGTVIPVVGKYVGLTSNTTMTQKIEMLPNSLLGKLCTFSIDAESITTSVNISFPNVETDTPNIVTFEGGTIELGFVSGVTTLCGISCNYTPYIKITVSKDINIKRLFLELGSIGHMKQIPPMDYGKNLMTCHRYFVVYGGSSLCYPCIAVSQNKTRGTMIANLPCQMRLASVSCKITGTPLMRSGLTDYGTMSTWAESGQRNSSSNSLHAIFDCSDGNMTEGVTYVVRMEKGTSISISADL